MEAVEDVRPVVGDASKLVFAPAYFQEAIWNDYRAYINSLLEEPVDEADFSYSEEEEENDDDEDDEEVDDGASYEARIDRVIEKRQARIADEEPLIVQAENEWRSRRHEQEEKKERIEGALQELFELMPRLREIEIHPWEFQTWGKLRFENYQANGRQAHVAVDRFLSTIAHCLQKADRHIRELRIFACDPRMIKDVPAMRHIFKGLRQLTLNMDIVDSLLEESAANHELPTLLKEAQPTLEHLEIKTGGLWPQLPSRGVHVLSKIFNNGDPDNSSMTFPNLKTFTLGSLLVSTASLLDFVAAQPRLSKLEFGHVYLVTAGQDWTYLATRLPKTVQTWEAYAPLGSEPFAGFEPPIAYNWCKEWQPQREPLPASTGWEGKSEGSRTYFRRIGE